MKVQPLTHVLEYLEKVHEENTCQVCSSSICINWNTSQLQLSFIIALQAKYTAGLIRAVDQSLWYTDNIELCWHWLNRLKNKCLIIVIKTSFSDYEQASQKQIPC